MLTKTQNHLDPAHTLTTCVRLTPLISLLAAACALSAPKTVPFGVNFSPYENGQNPSLGTLVIKPGEVLARLKVIRGTFVWVRTVSVTHGMETAGALAHQLGFKVTLGAWLGSETDPAGLASNRQEIANLIAAANRGEADLLVVGSEVLQRGDLPATTLLAYMQQVRSAVHNVIPVTTDDTYNELLSNPSVIAGSDIVLANFYPYWEGTRIDGAIASLDSDYQLLAQTAGSKPIWVGETGWPSGGNAIDLAVPNPNNAAYYFLAFNSWAKSKSVNAFYFEAFDEAWKVRLEGPQGAHWGIRTSAGTLKAGMSLVYEGFTLPSTVFMRQIPEPTLPGPPNIQLTVIPAYGSANGIAGVVSGVQTAGYKVATYINVDGALWTKPYADQPAVPISSNGSFTCATVTGGHDADATEYAVFVVPSGYAPPVALGTPDVPAEISSYAVASATVSRPIGYRGSVTILPVTTIGSLSISRNFATAANNADIVVVSGTIPVDNTKAAGAIVTVNIGTASWQFAPVAKNGIAAVSAGNCANPSGSIAITAGKSKWAFSARMECAPGNTNWNDEGLVDATMTAPGIPVFMPVTITVGGQDYTRTTSGYYTAQSGKKGTLHGASLRLGGGL